MKKLLYCLLFLNIGAVFGQESMPKYDEPRFPDCNCAGYSVQVSIDGKPGKVAKNGDVITFPDGVVVLVDKKLNCKGTDNSNYCETCQTLEWKVINADGKDFTKWSSSEIPAALSDQLECNKTYYLIIQGKCGCNICPPFILTLKKDCCNCNQLPQKPVISGPTFLCLTKPCDQLLTYSVPKISPENCFTYNWTVSNESGGTIIVKNPKTNEISFNCKDLKPGVYNITIEIRCKDKLVTSTIQLIVCEKPNPNFSMLSDGGSATFSGVATPGTDYWFLIADNDGSCSYTSGDTYVFQGSDPATFTGLVVNKDYMMWHFVYNSCGNKGGCWSSKQLCFKWLPEVAMKIATNNGSGPTNSSQNKSMQNLKQLEVNELKEIPEVLKSKLPKEMILENKASLSPKSNRLD